MFWTLYKEWCINNVITAPDWYWKAASIGLIVLLVAGILTAASFTIHWIRSKR